MLFKVETKVCCEVQGERFDSPLHAFSACILLPLPFLSCRNMYTLIL
jgi:hypothetical protein